MKQCQECGPLPEGSRGGREPGRNCPRVGYVRDRSAMLHYPAASLSTGYGYSYTSYPSYSSSLLLLSRYSNARYARVDVPDWDFRPRPGQNRKDPSGTISRGRSVVRIRTIRAGKRRGKTPGERLVEKFIIRGPTGSAVSEAGGRFAKTPGPVSGKDDRGGKGPAIRVPENCGDLCAKIPEIVRNQPSSAQKPAKDSPKSFRNSPNNSPQKTPRNSPENPLKSDKTPSNSPATDLCKSCEDLCDEIPEIVGNPPSSAQNPPEPARDFSRNSPQNLLTDNLPKKDELSPKTQKKLKTYAKSKNTDLLKKEPDKFTTDLNKCEIPDEIEQVSKSQPFKENSADFDPENAPKLLNFTAKAPPGVQKVQPLKPLPDINQIRLEPAPSNGVSETKVKVPTNAKCAEAKTENKFSVPISPNRITSERNPENLVEFDLGKSITTKFSDTATKPTEERPTNQHNSEFHEKLSDFCKRKTTEPTKTAKVDKTQQRATTPGQTKETPSESLNLTQNENFVSNLKKAKNAAHLNKIDVVENVVSDDNCKNNGNSGIVEKGQSESKNLKLKAEPKSLKDNQPSDKKDEPKKIVKTFQKDQLKTNQGDSLKAAKVENLGENNGSNVSGQVEQISKEQKDAGNGENVVKNGDNGLKNKKVDDNNNKVLCLRDLSELGSLYEEFRIVGESQSEDLGEGWEILEVIVNMEGTKKKKKVIVKKKGSKVKVTPIEAKPPVKGSGDVTASPGDITRQLSKKRVSLADDELNLVGFSVDRKTSITDDVLVEEAALFDKMIKKELKDARKSSLAFPPIAEDKEVADALAALAAKASRTPSPKRWVPSPQERREMWKKNALRQSKKGLGGFFKPQASSPTTSSSESGGCFTVA